MNIRTVTVAVNYLDLLSYTWSLNKTEIDHLTVITDSRDKDTHKFCEKNNINIFVTDEFYSNNTKFSKSGALNHYFKTENWNDAEWILLLDSDIVLNNTLSNFQKHFYAKNLDDVIIPNDAFVGIPLHVGPKQAQKQKPKIIYDKNISDNQHIHSSNDVYIEECLFSCPREIYDSKYHYDNKQYSYEKCYFFGYFHLFHKTAIKDKLEAKEDIFQHYDTAAVYDLDFAREYWPLPFKKTLSFPVHHLGPVAKNWEGRTTESWNLLEESYVTNSAVVRTNNGNTECND